VNVSINFYPTTRTLQIQGKGGNDLKILLIDLLVKNNEYEDDNSVIHQSPESEQDPCTTKDDSIEEMRELESFIDSAIETVGTDKEQARSSPKDGSKDEIKKVWEAIEVINSKIVALESITCKDEAVFSMATGPIKPLKDLIAFDNRLRDNELLKSKLSEAETEIRRIKKENLSLITALK
jgi:spore cortex formation protein SpoVR/YcgB (stage V sporulation)